MATTTVKTPAREATAEPTYTPVFPVSISADDVKTEQEKSTTPDPVGEAKEPTEKVEKMALGVKEPYPTGKGPDPEEAFYQAHGYRREQPET